MVKILSQAGNSLADVYDVAGSVAGIEQLRTEELPIVHEMGATVFSERFSLFIRRAGTAALNQNTAFDVVLSDLPDIPWRLLNVTVLADVAARTTHAQVSLVATNNEREVPVFVWDTANDAESRVRIIENGGAVGNQVVLLANPLLVPNMGAGSDQPQGIADVAFRGLTSGFGAGTVQYVALYAIAFAQFTAPSSRGLPLPSW